MAYQHAEGRYRAQWSRPGLRCLLDVLDELGLATGEPARVGSLEDTLLGSFERYLLSERGLAAGTARGHVSHARRFLGGLSSSSLVGVTAGDVTPAAVRESAAVSVSTTQYFVAGLRTFRHFCFVEGMVEVNLSRAALPATGRRRSALRRGSAPPMPVRCWVDVLTRHVGQDRVTTRSECC